MAKHFRQPGGQPSAGGRDNRGPVRQNPYLSTSQQDGQPAPQPSQPQPQRPQQRPEPEPRQAGEGRTPRPGPAPAPAQESSEWPALPSDFAIPVEDHGAPSSTDRGSEVVRVKRRRRRKRAWPKVVLVVAVVLVVVCGICGAVLVNDARGLRDDASSLMNQVDEFSKAATSGDSDAVKRSAASIAGSAQAMHRTTEGPIWAASQFVPVLGTDVRQARELCSSLDDLATNGIVPLGDALAGVNLKNLVGSGGTVDIPTLQQLIQALGVMQQPLGTMANTLDSMEPFHIGKLNELIDKARPMVDNANRLVGEAGNVLPAVPNMLGANGQTKTYLVLAMTGAEIRAAGGFPGSWGTVSVTDGHLQMGEFSSMQMAALGDVDLSYAVEPDEASVLNAGSMANTPGSVTMTPQFPRVAQVAAEYWRVVRGQNVDGVVAVTPEFLAALMGLTGASVTEYGFTVDANNVNQVLSHDAYNQLPAEQTDAFFSAVAGRSFDAVVSGLGNAELPKLAETFGKQVEAGTIKMWMANEQAQAVVQALSASGELSQDPVRPVLGVYVNDQTWSKIDWYLDMATTVGDGVKNADGTTSYQVITTLANTMTAEEASGDVDYIVGGNPLKRDRGDMVTGLILMAPAGGSISDVSGSGGVFAVAAQGQVYGFDAVSCNVQDLPGETTTVTYTVTTSPQATEPLAVQSTPLARSFG